MNTQDISRRGFLKQVGYGAALLAAPSALAAAADAPERPNIVYILADDLGYGDPFCQNAESKAPTPNMDRLAKEGMRFTDAHSPSAVCTPTRYGILTGRYSWRTRLKKGVLMGYSEPLIEPGRMTVASMLKAQGYATGCVGKWHLGLDWAKNETSAGEDEKKNQDPSVDFTKPIANGPLSVGFDYFFGIPASLDMAPYCYIEGDRVTAVPDRTVPQSGNPYWRAGPISPDFKFQDVLPSLAAKAVDFIDRQSADASKKSFFLYFPLTAPHTPVVPNDFSRGRSKAGEYGDFVVEVDWAIGQVAATLKRAGLDRNTLLIVTSDNGSTLANAEMEKQYGHRPNGPWRGRKADIWEAGHRIPFIARWPGHIEPAATCDETICLTDLMATCAAVVGQPLPNEAGEDSYSILPLLLGKKVDGPIRPATVHHSLGGMFAIREGDWKLIEGLGSGGFTQPSHIEPKEGEPLGQLYNLADDPKEEKNLWLERQDMVKRLGALLERYRSEGRSRP